MGKYLISIFSFVAKLNILFCPNYNFFKLLWFFYLPNTFSTLFWMIFSNMTHQVAFYCVGSATFFMRTCPVSFIPNLIFSNTSFFCFNFLLFPRRVNFITKNAQTLLNFFINHTIYDFLSMERFSARTILDLIYVIIFMSFFLIIFSLFLLFLCQSFPFLELFIINFLQL